MLDDRVHLSMSDALDVPADVLVVEDSGWLTATRGLAGLVAARYPALRALREQAVAEHGGSFPLGAAMAFTINDDEYTLRAVVWAVTWTYPQPTAQHAHDRVRATPLDVAAATRNALHQAAIIAATHVVLPALGSRLDYHVLPPTPKKLPRYVMGAAQLVAMQQALVASPIQQVTLSVSQRDYGIFSELLGRRHDEVATDE
jgi:hypothetical protein